jgi:hypothetical protein
LLIFRNTKKVIYIFVALLAFAVGVFAFFIRPLFVTVHLDELRDNIKIYNSQKIKVKGNFSATNWDSKYVYYLDNRKEQCDEANVWKCNYSVELKLSEELEISNFSLIKEITEKNEQIGKEFRKKEQTGQLEQKDFDNRYYYRAEIEIVGYVEVEKRINNFGHARMSYFPKIKVEEMKLISPIKLGKVP